jgi:hypothetical protein
LYYISILYLVSILIFYIIKMSSRSHGNLLICIPLLDNGLQWPIANQSQCGFPEKLCTFWVKTRLWWISCTHLLWVVTALSGLARPTKAFTPAAPVPPPQSRFSRWRQEKAKNPTWRARAEGNLPKRGTLSRNMTICADCVGNQKPRPLGTPSTRGRGTVLHWDRPKRNGSGLWRNSRRVVSPCLETFMVMWRRFPEKFVHILSKDKAVVNFMHPSSVGSNSFKWPRKADKDEVCVQYVLTSFVGIWPVCWHWTMVWMLQRKPLCVDVIRTCTAVRPTCKWQSVNSVNYNICVCHLTIHFQSINYL